MNDSLFRALGVFLDAMRLFAVGVLEKHFPGKDTPWEGEFFSRLTPAKQETWLQAQRQGTPAINRIDYNNLATFGIKFKSELTDEIGRDEANRFIGCMQELQEVRNRCQHYMNIDDDEMERAYSNMKLVARKLGMTELVDEIKHIAESSQAPQPEPQPQPQAETSAGISSLIDETVIDESSPVPAWFNNVRPHFDIQSGTLDESVFAANINEVVLGTAPEVYLNPSTFFQKTYITDGLRNISNRVVKALNGEETENRVISLQTGFGGGKTHTLISLYHVVKAGKALLQIAACSRLFNAGVTPNFDRAKVAVFTNNTTDVTNGRNVEEHNITINTLWGELAYQLGGIEAYNLVRKNDEERLAPNTTIFKPIIEKAKPALILIDELADYCVKANGKRVGNGTLYTQTLSFVQTLTEAVSQTPQCVLIATLPASPKEVATSVIGQEILESLQNRIVRIGSSVKPVDDEEVFEVIRRRLFEQLPDDRFIAQIANRYKKMYYDSATNYPDGAGTAAYAERIKKAYPFHPELIYIFRDRWGSDSRFQRTRGVLRLLASIVQNLWRRRQSLTGTQALIQSGDLVLNDLNTVTDNIVNLQGSQWETVILADVAGASSNAVKIDEASGDHNHVAQAVATTLLLASVGATSNKGMTTKQIMLNVMKPKSFRMNDVNAALLKLEGVAHYLYSNTRGEKIYWFQSKPNINILINQAKANVSNDEVNADILKNLISSTRLISGRPKVLVDPSGDVPEQKQLALVILHPQYTVDANADLPYKVKKFVTDLALQRGSSNRVYRNTILFLACSSQGQAVLKNAIQEGVACTTILAEYAGQLEADQKRDIEQRRQENDRKVRDALIKAYSVVLRCSPMGEISTFALTTFASEFSSQIQHNLLDEIESNEWLIKSIGAILLRKNNLMPEEPTDKIKVNDIYEAFLKNGDKPMIIGAEAVINSINRYCTEGLFNVAFYDGTTLKKVYHEQSVPMLSVEDEGYCLVHESVRQPYDSGGSGEGSGSGAGDSGGSSGGGFGSGESSGSSGNNGNGAVKIFRTVSIHGQVPIENYSQLFASFIQTLKNNHLKINIAFEARTTEQSPLAENSALVRSIRESASQLGLDIEFESE